MPLPNDEWASGKCGLKGLQYMALEVPTIMSPVGVNSEIIQQGENGYLAETQDEWIEKLSLLIEDEQLRLKLGKAGRATVVDKFSVLAWQDKYVQLFNALSASK
jgi:glycosyltransferase involved in cell wall biosynthesis